MNLPERPGPAGTIPVNLDHLSKGVDRILQRWVGDNRPTKLTLLNDIAAALSPGSNWGALRARQSGRQPVVSESNARLIPQIDRSAPEHPARLAEIKRDENRMELIDLTTEVRPLFGMRYAGDPIIGLQLNVTEGNGYSEASIYAKLILSRDGELRVQRVYAPDLDPHMAQLVYNAIQNLDSVDLYPTLAQGACPSLCILLGPFDGVVSIPEHYSRGSDDSFKSQGARVLLDEGETPSIKDVDLALRLASATVPHLGLKQFEDVGAIRFKLSQPLMEIWEPEDFTVPERLDDRPMFWIPTGQYWAHQDEYLIDNNIWTMSTLGEPLDLALALVDIDDPDVYLHVSLTPMPKRSRKSSALEENWRGGFHREFEVLRLREGEPVKKLSLHGDIKERFETGLMGWAIHEGHEVVEDLSRTKIRALIPRDVRRASQHLPQVEAIMNGVDPTDRDLLKRIRDRR
ncbi:hypothetical protein [Tritonibacter scottomollicae]|uniref:hypothetical protein n=1 Tax=Tritonibacter scottomollicae TaxID=483013 RepID=UPI003AA7F137